MGAYATFDRGTHWTTLGTNLPPVPVYDLLFQESQGALVLGTHGRSIWVLDHIEPLAQLTQPSARPAALSVPRSARASTGGLLGPYWFGSGEFFAPNPAAGATITYYLPKHGGGIEISISDSPAKPIRTLHGPGAAGLNRVAWDLRRTPAVSGRRPQSPAWCLHRGGRRPGGVAAENYRESAAGSSTFRSPMRTASPAKHP